MPILFMLAMLAALLSVTELSLRCLPALGRAVLEGDGNGRLASLDGLRGLLALFVFLHHTLIIHDYAAGRPWQAPSGNVENLIGRAAVALFFMISAYLFFGRILRTGGRLDWIAFLRGRVLRLAPLYYVAVALLLLVVAVETGFSLHVPAGDLLRQSLRWAGFGFLGMPDINGLSGTWTSLSTIWTLPYEWRFYAALPFLALAYRFVGKAWPILIVAGAAALIDLSWIYYLFFAAGAIVATTESIWTHHRTVTLAVGAASLIALPIFFHDVEGVVQAVLLLFVFAAALQSRVLQGRAVRFLGHISYGVYLLHNPLLHIACFWIVGPARFSSLDIPRLYAAATLIGIAIVALSTLTFLVVEKPFLHAGHRRSLQPGTAEAAQQVAP
jgi:peptidoglycan/LPS O-acetylase OafA/YrhL